MVRLQLILFSKITGAFLFRTFGGFFHVPTLQIYCLTDAIISETRLTNIYLNIMYDPPQPILHKKKHFLHSVLLLIVFFSINDE